MHRQASCLQQRSSIVSRILREVKREDLSDLTGGLTTVELLDYNLSISAESESESMTFLIALCGYAFRWHFEKGYNTNGEFFNAYGQSHVGDFSYEDSVEKLNQKDILDHLLGRIIIDDSLRIIDRSIYVLMNRILTSAFIEMPFTYPQPPNNSLEPSDSDDDTLLTCRVVRESGFRYSPRPRNPDEDSPEYSKCYCRRADAYTPMPSTTIGTPNSAATPNNVMSDQARMMATILMQRHALFNGQQSQDHRTPEANTGVYTPPPLRPATRFRNPNAVVPLLPFPFADSPSRRVEFN